MRGLSWSRRPTCVRTEGLSCRPRLPAQPGEGGGRHQLARGRHIFLCKERQ